MEGPARLWPLRLLLGIFGLITLVLAAGAAYLLSQRDESGSLAAATAAATFALASVAILTIDQNRAVVRAAIEEANASRETVEEMRRQRELAYQPWLVVERVTPEHPTDRIAVPAYRVTNIGAGPAINVALSAMRVRAAADLVHLWVSDETQGIEPGGRWDVFAGFTTSQGKGRRHACGPVPLRHRRSRPLHRRGRDCRCQVSGPLRRPLPNIA